MNQHIRCIVRDCHYWQEGNKCVANEILVSTDGFGAQQPDHVDASMASQLSPAEAGNCLSTCCKTYVSKGSASMSADQATPMS